jgi:hypothetical protein
MRGIAAIVLVALMGFAGVALGQPAAPATAPVAPRYAMTMPPGYEKVVVGEHTAVCRPGDVEWVKRALGELKPATRPTTMPADVARRVAENRAAVIKQMVADLALPDDKGPVKLFDEELLPTLKKLETLRPPVFFLVVTRDALREVARDGWGEPKFHYNRTAGEVSIDDRVTMAIDRPMDDAVLPVFYDEKGTPDARAKELAGVVGRLDAELAGQVSQQAEPMVFNLVAEHIGKSRFDPLKLRRDQQWFALGVTGYLACKYTGQLTPTPKEEWLRRTTFESPRYPVGSRSIDLTKPVEESAMRPVAVPHYNQAMRRKGAAAVARWAEKGGDASLTRVLVAIGTKAPADGAALVTLIREAGGVDVAGDLAAK